MGFHIRLRNIFYAAVAIFLAWFLYIERHVLIPFAIAMIFAYVFNPLIDFFQTKLKIPRAVSIVVVYILLIGSGIAIAFFFTRSLVNESQNIEDNFETFSRSLRGSLIYLPIWMRSYAADYVNYFSKNPFIISRAPLPVFSRAFSGILGVFAFFFASFFFLKDNKIMVKLGVKLAPEEYRKDLTNLLHKINYTLSSYLRGQMILIISMILMLMLCFGILGVKYAITISILSALCEIVPILGPIVAGILGTIIVVVSGGVQNFSLSPIQTVIMVAAIYYLTRQIQDYVIAPYVISKATNLHPLIILFSVLAGEHLYGLMGVLLAVPIAATVKIIYEFVILKIQEKDGKAVNTS